MAFGHLEEHFGCAGRMAATLFPVLERAGADSEQGGELALGQTQFGAGGRNAVLWLHLEGSCWLHLSALNGDGLLDTFQ